jgi:uncharacterized low-complexity protein
MKSLLATLSCAFAVAAATTLAHAAVTPCEDMLKDLRAAEAAAKLGDADAAKVKALEDKGIERCNADDDKRADDFFAQAMTLMGK